METININTTFMTHACATHGCGIVFATEGGFDKRRQEDHLSFYCPNGHSMSYQGKTDAQRERERAERLQQQLKRRETDLQNERKRHSATKGQLTKTRKRTANGVCPCCNRTFANVGRHMNNKHPDFVESTK